MKRQFKFIYPKLLYVFIVSAALWSCIDKDDFKLDTVEGVEWTGSYAVPVINSTLTINDLIGENDSVDIKEDADGMIYLEYVESVLNYDIKNSFVIPSASFNKQYPLPDIKLPAINAPAMVSLNEIQNSSMVALPQIPDMVFITFSEGTLSITASNRSDVSVSFKADILNRVDNSLVGTAVFNALGSGSSATMPVLLAGQTLRNEIIVSLTPLLPIVTTDYSQLVDLSIVLNDDAKASEGEIVLQEDVVINATEPLDFEVTPEQYHEILLKAGNFNYNFNSDINYTTEVNFALSSFQKAGVGMDENFVINGAGNQSFTYDLAKYTADLTTLTPAYNRFPMDIQIVCKKSTNTFRWTASDVVSVDISMDNLEYTHIKGFFGEKNIPLERNSFNIDVFENTFETTDISLKDPEISFKIHNEYGVPIQLNFTEFSASKDGEVKDIITSPASPITLAYPETMQDKAGITDLSVTNGGEIMDLAPDLFTYEAEGKLNSGLTSGSNFLTDTSKVAVEMKVKINLWGKASNIEISDTLENSLEQDIEDVTVESIKLKALIVNEFPIDAKVQIYFADENYVITDSLFTTDQTALVTSSTVNENGGLIEAGKYDQLIEVNKAKFERLLQAPNLIVKGNLATAEAGQKDVKIKSGYKLDVKIGLQTKLNLKVKVN
ncbi:MAG TPA: hypothetical protein VD908_21320 [Cytophagales bacterium]|nr:hypothetical protein [Cytophagales bacterium]